MHDGDFYTSERGAAAYFEREWADLIAAQTRPRFAYPAFPLSHLHSSHSAAVAAFLAERLGDARPASLLEIGSSVGRTFVEVSRVLPSLRRAVLVEPSDNLRRIGTGILTNSGGPYPMLRGNGALQQVTLDTGAVAASITGIDWSTRSEPFAVLPPTEPAALVVCLNVMDQCWHPWSLIDFLRDRTPPGGHLLVSCTYQWQTQKLGALQPPTNIVAAFGPGWVCRGQAEIPFKGRANERFWRMFLSHTALLQRVG